MMKTKNCPSCGLAVSDEYRFCLECGTDLKIEADSQEPPSADSPVPPTVVWPGPTQPPPSGPNLGGNPQSQAPQSTIIFQGPSPNPRSVSSTTDAPRSKLPWFLVGICVLVIGVLCYVTLFRNKSRNDNSLSQIQSATPSPTLSSQAATASPTITRSEIASPSPTPSSTPTPPPSSETASTIPTQAPTPSVSPIDTPKIYTRREVDQPVTISSKPQPSYTEEARKNQVIGTVVLRVVFGADGSIGTVSVVRGLPNGLSEQAIVAARRIKFVPAQKNGLAVSTVVQLEYNFNLY